MDKLLEVLKNKILQNDKVLADWKKKLDTSPMYALEWSSGAFEAAAHNHVYGTCVEVLESIKDSPEAQALFKKYVEDYALQTASNIESSTSIYANRIRDLQRQAWAKVARFNGIWI